MARSRALSLTLAVAGTAIALPVTSGALWLGGAYGATREQLEAGLWILKGALVLTAGAVWLTLHAAPEEGPQPPRASAPARSDVLLLGGTILVGLALRLYELRAELWLDELETLARYIPLSLRELVSTYDSKNNHPLYTLMARMSHDLAGGADWSIRLPAVAFGVASLWATWHVASRLTSQAESLLAALILCVSYHHVWFSQNARGYTAMLFLSLLATGSFLRLTSGHEARPARLAWGYAGLMALAAYTHLTAALIAVGHAMALVLGTPWRRGAVRTSAVRWPAVAIMLSGLLTITLYALVLPQAIQVVTRPTMDGVAIEWTGLQWMLAEAFRVLGQGIPGGGLTVALALVVLAVGVASYWRQSRMLVLATLLPVGITAFTMLALGHNLWPRFFFFAAAYFVLFALRGGFVLTRLVLREHAGRVAVVGALAVAGLSALTVPRAWQPKQQFDEVARFIERERRDGDDVVALDVAAYAYEMRGAPAGWRLATDADSAPIVQRSAQRTWVVYTFTPRLRALYPAVAAQLREPPFREVRVFPATVGGGEIHVLLNERASPDE